MSIVKLSKSEVTIKEKLTWGDVEAVKASMASSAKFKGAEMSGVDGDNMLQSKYTLLKRAIVSIKEGEITIPFSIEWMNNLDVEDGEALYTAVDKLQNSKKE